MGVAVSVRFLLLGVLLLGLPSLAQTAPQEPPSRSSGLALAAPIPQSETASTPTETIPVGIPEPTNPNPPAADDETKTPTLLDDTLPSDRTLLLANNELLAKNAALSRQVDTLTTQVNVLVQERSGQLYIYGAMTAIFCVILGFVFAKLTTKRRW